MCIRDSYITYRYLQSLKRQTNTTDERILSLIECQNEEVKQENANKMCIRDRYKARERIHRGMLIHDY